MNDALIASQALSYDLVNTSVVFPHNEQNKEYITSGRPRECRDGGLSDCQYREKNVVCFMFCSIFGGLYSGEIEM